MFFLNFTAGEFLGLLGALGGIVTALYLLDRAKRKKVVSTLRFWSIAATGEEQQRRKRMHEPWSLVLQLVSLLLLLLAIARLQWGTSGSHRRDNVLLLDTSSWTSERSEGGTLLEREKAVARKYLATLPSQDRVMLVRADGLATPVTPFTSDRAELLNALDASGSEFSALNIEQALSFARQAQGWSGAMSGEIVYLGPRLISDRGTAELKIDNLRTIAVPANRGNCGILRMGVKRSDDEENSWHATVAIKNYSSERRAVRLKTQFAGTPFASRAFALAPGEEISADYNFVTYTAGQLISEIAPGDSLSSDDRAVLYLPRTGLLKVAVYTDRPEVLRPLLEANHRLRARMFAPSEYQPQPAADVMLLDQMAAPKEPKIASLWIQPPREQSPLPVRTSVSDALIKSWRSETALGTGLHAKETHVPYAEVFQTFEGDMPVANIAEGPIVVARASNDARPKLAVIGFDPLQDQLRFEVTTPLLFANLMRWLAPEAFRTLDITAGQVGEASVALDPMERAGSIRIRDENGFAIPFAIRNQTLQLFASRPSAIHIVSDGRERVLSLTIPQVASFEWKPPSNTRTGLPRSVSFAPEASDLWKWLAVLGGLGLLTEWVLFGQRRALKWRKSKPESKRQEAKQRERDLVAK